MKWDCLNFDHFRSSLRFSSKTLSTTEDTVMLDPELNIGLKFFQDENV